ncbi:hypothetical protein CQ10_39755 [Bradyrhizobium valentinum]|uniref:Uncharacterized protein n=1 Tax=Bradyrhizobium valentinum TaxID=1518501 RepID=A0A0R3L5S8_9BRAD|nr:hypothetical protein CP49_15130 [Bradyrhizobium valentinum]KRR12310.1 hypothetical protein CQ10_39755 [Bradyrhizobium valentinum]
MHTSDQDVVLKALEDARRILSQHSGQGPLKDAKHTVERLLAVLNRVEVDQALDRMKRRRTLRIMPGGPSA